MSMGTSFYAEYANEEKDKWTRKLRHALEKEDWALVRYVLIEMEKFQFSE